MFRLFKLAILRNQGKNRNSRRKFSANQFLIAERKR